MLQLPLHLFRIPDAFSHIEIAAELHAVSSLPFPPFLKTIAVLGRFHTVSFHFCMYYAQGFRNFLLCRQAGFHDIQEKEKRESF